MTPNIVALVANIVVDGVVMKEEPNLVSQNLNFFVPMAKFLFIDLCDSFDKDGPSFPYVVVLFYGNSWLAKK
jgi:hypothetical protein